MSLISGTELAKSYGPQDVFAGVTVAIPYSGRIALVGPNGAGKTTLLRLLAGQEEPSAGTVGRAKGVRIGYLPQEAIADGDPSASRTLWQEMLAAFADLRAREAELARMEAALADSTRADGRLEKYGALQEAFERDGGYTYETRLRQVLGGLGFDADDFNRPLPQLSGGQQTRALLARLLLAGPDLLVLDEPTNHLDVQAVEWLEAWLNDWDGAVLVVSHDRYFLDRVVKTVWELEAGRLETYSGNYSAYVVQRTERRERQLTEFEAQQAFIAKESEFIRRNIAGQNTRQAKGRLRRLERLRRTSPPENAESQLKAKPREAKTIRVDLKTHLRSGDRVLETKDLVVGYPDEARPLFRAPDLLLWRGECAALIGPNGAGKTTFLKTLLGQVPPLAGMVRLGASLQVGYFAQAHEGLQPERTVLEEITSEREMPVSAARDYLARFLFTGDDVFKTVDVLSGGERGRVALAKLALSGANFLLLDEPTNHLDLPAQEVLEAVLGDFPGTTLLVSHDRYLIDALATQVWALEAGELRLYEGNYSQYVEARQAADGQPVSRQIAGEHKGEAAERGKREARKAEAWARKQAARLAELEAIIASLEQRLEELSAELEAAGIAQAVERVRQLGEEYSQVEAGLLTRLDEWEQLAAASR